MQKKYKTYDFFLLVKFARKKIFEEVRKNNREKARIGVSKSAKENLSRPANYFRHDCNKKKTNQPALVAKRQRMIWSPWTAARKKAIIFFIIIRCYSSLRCKHFFLLQAHFQAHLCAPAIRICLPWQSSFQNRRLCP